jgi:hypothetical protein
MKGIITDPPLRYGNMIDRMTIKAKNKRNPLDMDIPMIQFLL